jgi:hypothetical protein
MKGKRKLREAVHLSKYRGIFLELIQNNKEIMKDLATIRELKLPDWYVTAGYLRNYIWDSLHNYSFRTPLNDIDVIYYNSEEIDEVIDKKYEHILEQKTGISIWSVKNQARMHINNGDQPYKSSEYAISHWPETVTAIGVRLEGNNSLSIASPFGLDDLFEFKVRKSPLFLNESYFLTRVKQKRWQEIWSRLEMVADDSN